MELSGKVALITGGASGLGAACARMICQEGGKVVLVDLDAERGEKLAQSFGESVIFARADVSSTQEVGSAVQVAREQFGGLHVAINCAGIAVARRVIGKDGPAGLDEFSSVLRVNLIGTFNVTRLAAFAMAAGAPGDEKDGDGERGVIINTASAAAFDGQIGQVAYAASKGGIVSMTLPLARDLARHGIRVVSIAPGVFDTPMMAGMPDKVRRALEEQVPFPSRLGRAAEFAALARHIIENRMLNGEVIRLDGALRMPPR